jgi:enamine deaminase RidA (YjgF/YER057c/UK114 family)
MNQAIADRLADLDIELPTLPEPQFSYVPGKQARDLVYVSGQTPTVDGKPVYVGRCGDEIDVATGQQAARLTAINLLAELELVVGLEHVAQIVKLEGFVAASDGFIEAPAVVNGASELLYDVLGEAGKHARIAIGVSWLPGNAPVELQLIAQVNNTSTG